MQLFNSSSRVTPRVAPPKWSRPEPQNLHLLLTRVRSAISRQGRGSVVAFTSANQGEGVSHVVRFFAERLALQTKRRTAVIDAPRLRQLDVSDLMNMRERFPETRPNLWLLPNEPLDHDAGGTSKQKAPWADNSEWSLDPLQALSATFSYTLVDCPALGTSHDAEMLAPEVDGIVLVVEADRTKRDQILRARRTIEMANGNLMGLVLNKRRHVVPDWLYRML